MLKYLDIQEKIYLEKSNLKSLTRVLAKVYRTLEKIDSAGVSLNKIFELYARHFKFAFKMFFINLDIWGSLKSNNLITIAESKNQIEFARITIERCLVSMKNEKGKLFENVRYHTTVLLNCLEKLSNYFKERTKISRSNSKSKILKHSEEGMPKFQK